jgi:hypothetical protein
MNSILADWADESFAFAVGINTDEVENLTFMEVSFVAFQVSHSQLSYLIGFKAHQLIIKIRPMYSDRHNY